MYLTVHQLIALGGFSLLGWAALLYFACDLARERLKTRRQRSDYEAAGAKMDAFVRAMSSRAQAKLIQPRPTAGESTM